MTDNKQWATPTPLRPDGTNLLLFPVNALPPIIGDMAFCKDWGGKYHGELLRLCGIIHCIKCALNDVEPVENRVTLDTLCNAIEIGEYFCEQAIYAYSLGDVVLGTIKAERVLNKIRSKHIMNIRQNDL